MSLMILESRDLAIELLDLGVESLGQPRDARHFCPSLGWLEEFAAAFHARNHQEYKPESFDCEDFAMWFVVSASRSLYEAGFSKDCGHTVCYDEVDTVRLLGVGPGMHANNIARCDDGRWYFIEPQNGRIEHAQTAINRGDCKPPRWVWL